VSVLPASTWTTQFHSEHQGRTVDLG